MLDEINPAFGDTPATQLFRLVITLAGHLRTRMDQRLAEIGLTTQQAAVLTYLENSDEAPTLGAVAAALGTTHQNARQIVDALERKGMATVTVDPDDRRARRVAATPAVSLAFADRNEDDHAAVAEWLSALTAEEQAEAVSLLNQALNGMIR